MCAEYFSTQTASLGGQHNGMQLFMLVDQNGKDVRVLPIAGPVMCHPSWAFCWSY